MSANDRQVGGQHYKSRIEPWDAILDWQLGYLDGSAVKYLSRWHKKGGIQDIQKAIHFLEKLIEVENARLRRASDPNGQTQSTIAGIVADAERRYGTRTLADATNRKPPAGALHQRTETGYGQPQDFGDIT